METQSEIDEVVLINVVESLLGKIRTNLDISMQVLEAVRNEQNVQLRKTMQDNQNKFMSSLSAASQPQMIWPEFISTIWRKFQNVFRISASFLSHDGAVLATTNVLHAISRRFYPRSPQNSSK